MLIREIALYIDSQNIGTFDETGTSGNIFISTIPPLPDECICIFPTGGPTGDAKLNYDNPNIQIWIRGTQHPLTGLEKANQVYKALQGFNGQAFASGGHYIVDCLGIQSYPIHIGKDDNERHEYSLNFSLEIKNN